MALFLSWCIRIDAGRTGAKGQDVRLLLRHRQGQGLTSANSYVKCRLKSDAESANMRVAHIFAHGEKSAKRLKTKGIPQTQGFMFIGTQCDLWGRPDGTGHEKVSRGNFPRLIFSLIPSLSVRQHFIGYADLIHDSRRICYPAKAGTKVVQPVPPRSAASFSSERVNK